MDTIKIQPEDGYILEHWCNVASNFKTSLTPMPTLGHNFVSAKIHACVDFERTEGIVPTPEAYQALSELSTVYQAKI